LHLAAACLKMAYIPWIGAMRRRLSLRPDLRVVLAVPMARDSSDVLLTNQCITCEKYT
jgi:hypothetical protein